MRCCKFIINLSVLRLLLLEIVVAVHYTNEWAIQIEGGPEAAKAVAEKHGYVYLGQIMPGYYSLKHKKVAKRSIYPSSYFHRTIAQEPNVRWLEQQIAKRRVKRSIYNYYTNFNDPKWPRMWYLNRGEHIDMNVISAWKQGITGRGVVVTILDDGIEKNHPDLQVNYDPNASYDVNNHDSDPQPRYDYSNENRHGTRCAGEVAAQAGNGICSVGVAFNARIGGVRMLDGDVTDSVEAQSLSLNPNHIDIYSASWGPDDDGRTVDGPATLAKKAFYDGITKGRGGLGSIFVWASGNGGRDGDSCNCDGYTNSIHTLSISSATENGHVPWYSEACSSTLATTYSSGSSGERQIVTTDLRRICTVNHTGTSASAPLAAGICALALQANPNLTWRDMQHIVVQTARKANLKAHDWVVNGVNREVSHSFGFGLMDAGAMVMLAKNWTTVPKQHVCEIRSQGHNKPIPMNGKIVVPLDTDGCERTKNHVKYLEHVQARITLSAARRGEIQIFLVSPMGTRSTLLARRLRDSSREGFNNWAFMTTHSWGETAKGRWFLEIENGATSFQEARLKDWVLVLFGTDQQEMTTTLSRTTTLSSPTSTLSRFRKEPPQIWVPHEPTTRYPLNEIIHKQSKSVYNNKNKGHIYSHLPNKDYYPYNIHPFRHEQHVCIFETLAKRNNMSTQQYMRLVRSNLSEAELKQWSLKMMGTPTHPQSQNISQPVQPNTSEFNCPGIISNGICIECRPGYYKHKDVCVAKCPDHYYEYMKTVPIHNKRNMSSRAPLYQRQGECFKCNEACKTCKGPNVKDCFQCSDDYEVRDSFCRKKLIMNFLDPDMLSFFVWVIILCTSAILLFGVVFIVLQARDHQILCWKEKRHYEDSKGKYNGVTSVTEERECGHDKFENINVVRNIHYRAEDLDFSITRPPPLPHRSLRS